VQTRKIPGVYVEEASFVIKPIEGVSLSDAVFVGECAAGTENVPTPVSSTGEFEASFGLAAKGKQSHRSDLMARSIRGYFENGGKKAWVIRVAEDRRHTDGRGLSSLADLDGVGAVCLPGFTWTDCEKTFIQGWLDAVVRTRHLLLIIDPPPGIELRSAADVKTLGLPASTYAVMYYPWLQVRREGRPARTVLLPPSGHVAGVWARVDADRGIWTAPAGVDTMLKVVSGLEFDVGDAEQGVLNPLGINALRDLPGHGPGIWGARLLSTASDPEWKYVNVRRFTNYIEHSIEAGTGWVVFESNDEPLWTAIKRSVETFLFGLFRQGSLVGTKPEEAFFVRCDSSTMTPNDIVNGIVNIFVGFAPLKPAEFVVLRISQKTARSKR